MHSLTPATILFISISLSSLTGITCASGCEFSCPQGYTKRPSGLIPQVNGCGVHEGLDFNPLFPAFTEICNDHDRCYAKCGATKEHCDWEFAKGMMEYCESRRKNSDTEFYRDCTSMASLYSIGVQSLGCSFYIAAQKQGCTCTRDRTV